MRRVKLDKSERNEVHLRTGFYVTQYGECVQCTLRVYEYSMNYADTYSTTYFTF